ncbi:hypothetical protein MTO96_010693 [Rhipicephalus appendiculatus]
MDKSGWSVVAIVSRFRARTAWLPWYPILSLPVEDQWSGTRPSYQQRNKDVFKLDLTPIAHRPIALCEDSYPLSETGSFRPRRCAIVPQGSHSSRELAPPSQRARRRAHVPLGAGAASWRFAPGCAGHRLRCPRETQGTPPSADRLPRRRLLSRLLFFFLAARDLLSSREHHQTHPRCTLVTHRSDGSLEVNMDHSGAAIVSRRVVAVAVHGAAVGSAA